MRSRNWIAGCSENEAGEMHGDSEIGNIIARDVIVWTLDEDGRSRQWVSDSIESMMQTHSFTSGIGRCNYLREHSEDKRIPLSVALVIIYAVSKEWLECKDILKSYRRMNRYCSSTKIVPSTLNSLYENVNGLTIGQVYIFNVEEDDWQDTFEKTIYPLENNIAIMETRHRASLTRSHANHYRFLLDKFLLSYGVERALYLDTDTCVRGTHGSETETLSSPFHSRTFPS